MSRRGKDGGGGAWIKSNIISKYNEGNFLGPWFEKKKKKQDARNILCEQLEKSSS